MYKSSLWFFVKYFFSKIFKIRKKFNNEINKEIMSTIFWIFDWMIKFSELVGKKPPVEIKLMERLSELNILTPEIFNAKKIIKLNKE